jgi:hypothetical protein
LILALFNIAIADSRQPSKRLVMRFILQHAPEGQDCPGQKMLLTDVSIYSTGRSRVTFWGDCFD